MLTERAGCQLVAFEDTIYALGGFNEDSCLDSVEYFDRNENCWVATTPMLDKRSDFGAVVHRNRIYVLGGNSHEEDVGNVATELDNVEYFDTNSKTWTRVRFELSFFYYLNSHTFSRADCIFKSKTRLSVGCCISKPVDCPCRL